jgi:biotin carboxylase
MRALSTTIQKILVANRGEIARRIMRTCRKMGIATVAVYSEADAGMPFVAEADEAVLLGPASSSESYLRIDKILEAAALTRADAIHPGYGFLAENAEFAEACGGAGVIFIGPTPDAIRSMGSKREAKALVAKAGVPVIPGYDGSNQDPKVLAKEAIEVGFPVLLKASAGGGGKGMKLVRQKAELPDAIASAAREGQSSFGDGTLLVEKYIDDPRHVEIQILGDSHGSLIHLNERECSIQRRHQKIIEETPSPALDAALRTQMGEAAVLCGKAIGYQNAGTVEFILAPDRSFYFLEVNTRLQVEHPVTECVTGLDLVEEQIRTGGAASHLSRRRSIRRCRSRGSSLCRRPGRWFPSAEREDHRLGPAACGGTAGRQRRGVGQRGRNPLRPDARQDHYLWRDPAARASADAARAPFVECARRDHQPRVLAPGPRSRISSIGTCKTSSAMALPKLTSNERRWRRRLRISNGATARGCSCPTSHRGGETTTTRRSRSNTK